MIHKPIANRGFLRKLVMLVLVTCSTIARIHSQAVLPDQPRAGAISGYVLTADGAAPLPQAIVSLRVLFYSISEDNPATATLGPPRTTVTGGDGAYFFSDVSPASYRLEIRRIGYRPTTVDVELRFATVVNVSAVLEVTPVHLEQLEVRATSLDLYGRAASLDEVGQRRIDIERWRQRAFLSSDVRALTHTDVLESVTLGTADPFRALHRLPGVTTRDDWTSEVWIRGANWGQTRVYFDGLPLFNPLHAGGVTSAINENALGSVLFHPGVRPLPLGEGAAGVVSMTSRPAGGQGDWRGYADVNLIGGGVTVERRLLDGRLGVLAGARKSGLEFITAQRELFRYTDDVTGQAFSLPDNYADATAHVDFGLGDNAVIEASMLWEHDWISDSLEQGGPAFNDFSWGNTAGRVTLDIPISNVYSRHTVGWSHFSLDVKQTQPRPSVSFYDWQQATQLDTDSRFDYFTAVGEFGSVIPEEDDAGWRAGYQVTINRTKYDGAPQSPHPFQVHVGPIQINERLIVASGWGEARMKPTPALTVQGGLRLDGTTAKMGRRLHIAPQVSARYTVNQRLSLSASTGRSYQYAQALAPAGLTVGPGLTVSHVWRLAQGDTVTPLQSDAATLGAEYWLADEWLASASLYARNSSGMALVDPTPGPKQTRPATVIGKNEARGIEISIRRIAGSVTMSANYSLGVSKIAAIRLRYPAPSDRRHTIDLTGAWRVPRKFLGGSIKLVAAHTAASGAPYTRVHPGYYLCNYVEDYCDEIVPDILELPNAARAPWYSALDILGEWTKTYTKWRFAILFEIRNILNRRNDITYGVTRNGPCWRQTVYAPFCQQGADEFRSGVRRQGFVGLKIEF